MEKDHFVSASYLVNEIFYSLQGEGVRFGTANVFVRFSQCNLVCACCDTEFESGREMTADEILAECRRVAELAESPPPRSVEGAHTPAGKALPRRPCRNVVFTGGEPLLQLDDQLGQLFHDLADRWFMAVETNGSLAVPGFLDWVSCSPKVAEHAVVPKRVDELKYVRACGQPIPHPSCEADHYLLSPRLLGDVLPRENLDWCVKLCLENPGWRLSVQHNKVSFGGLR